MKAQDLIRTRREALGWTITEAAERLGFSRDALRRREEGEAKIDLADAELFASVYGLPIERLHGLEPYCGDCLSTNVRMRPVKP